MRVLLTSNRGAGHVGPLVPFARAFLEAGHDVLLAAPEQVRRHVERAGAPYRPFTGSDQHERDAIFGSLSGLSRERQGVRVMREVFAGIDLRAALEDVFGLVREYRPDVVLREPTEYAGLLVAERLGVRHGRIAAMAAATETWGIPVVAGVLDRHRRRLGLRPDPRARAIHESPYLTVIPQALEDPADPGQWLTWRFREPAPDPWPLPEDDERPLVYVSYGTETPTRPWFPALFRATVAALADLPVRALFTIGDDVAREPLGPAPANVRIERWIPQAAVMRHAAAVVHHGGAGTTRMALAAGVPAVIVPGFADQFRNAERVSAIGAGLALSLDALPRLQSAVRLLLEHAAYREAARRAAAAVAALPAIDEAPAAVCDWLAAARAA
jgi:UDP:flavonoid glycosyltransferase YjiC (YdhE family)